MEISLFLQKLHDASLEIGEIDFISLHNDALRFLNDSYYGITPLHVACESGRVELVHWLVELGGNPYKVCNDDEDCLHKASFCGHHDIVKYLIDIGFDVTQATREFYYTPILLGSISGNVDVLKTLYLSGSCLSDRNVHGLTPLLLASLHGHISAIEWFVENGCSLDEVCYKGNNALHYSAFSGNLDTVKWLVNEKGISVKQKNIDGNTPLLISCSNSLTIPVINWLLENGSSLKENNLSGNYPIHVAILEKKKDTITYLLENGMSLECMNEHGISAFSMFQEAFKDEICLKDDKEYQKDKKLVENNNEVKNSILPHLLVFIFGLLMIGIPYYIFHNLPNS